jgi:type II secretory pathway pseudopilin PulG
MCARPSARGRRAPTVERVPLLDLLASAGGPWPASLAATVLVSVASAGATAALVDARARRRASNDERVVADIREAQDRLQAVRRAYRLRARNDPAAPDDSAVDDLRDALDTAALRTLSADVITQARHYLKVSSLYADDDPDSGDESEREAWGALSDALLKELRRRS